MDVSARTFRRGHFGADDSARRIRRRRLGTEVLARILRGSWKLSSFGMANCLAWAKPNVLPWHDTLKLNRHAWKGPYVLTNQK